jgi:hypothetical protein
MKKSSEYTKAVNCTDLTDLRDGADEISEAIEYRRRLNMNIPYYYHIRLGKIMDKIDKFERRTIAWYYSDEVWAEIDKLVS